MHIIMVKSILRRDIKNRREEAENRLLQIIKSALYGKSDDEKARIMEEFKQYFENDGLINY